MNEQFNTTRLFMLPFAGANMYSYRQLEMKFSPGIVVHSLELPGRGKRFGEKLLTNIDNAVNDLFDQMKEYLHEPYAVFGHSMGAVLGYLITKKIREEGYNMPLHLFCSGRSGLWNPSPEFWYLLPSMDFWNKISELGGLPSGNISNDELRSVFEPILRADFQLVQSVEAQEFKRDYKLDVPITVLFGKTDKITTTPSSWHKNSVQLPSIIYFEGNHFYFMDEPGGLANKIQQILSGHLSNDNIKAT